MQQDPAPTNEDISLLPQALQLQLVLLDCIDMLTRQSAATSLPAAAAADNVLLQQLLLPRALLLHRLQNCNKSTQTALLNKALDWQRHVALQVWSLLFSAWPGLQPSISLAFCQAQEPTRSSWGQGQAGELQLF